MQSHVILLYPDPDTFQLLQDAVKPMILSANLRLRLLIFDYMEEHKKQKLDTPLQVQMMGNGLVPNARDKMETVILLDQVACSALQLNMVCDFFFSQLCLPIGKEISSTKYVDSFEYFLAFI